MRTNLAGANLTNADLFMADLTEATLDRAGLALAMEDKAKGDGTFKLAEVAPKKKRKPTKHVAKKSNTSSKITATNGSSWYLELCKRATTIWGNWLQTDFNTVWSA